MAHADTCPLNRGVNRVLDEDREWFEAHPEVSVRIRPVTPPEVADLLAAGAARPTGDVIVLNLAPGLRMRRFTFAGGAR
ncbi:hypothetical protein [Cellulomonas uda]|nr:hypothetical protein [Cellulomonas uda]NII67417.1 hypothetical protein [Cellulomonas uda]